MRFIILRCVFGALVVLSITGTRANAVVYQPPVDGRVVDPFRPPTNPYGSGNRGWEYQISVGSEVRAPAAGIITFAGPVGGTLNVVILHDDGVRTTVSKLASIETGIAAGRVVEARQLLGMTKNELFFGARCGNVYLDPVRLFAPTAYLVPLEGGEANDALSDSGLCGAASGVISRDEMEWLSSKTVEGEPGLVNLVFDLVRAIFSSKFL